MSKAYYGLPSKVIFCKRCVMSNQRPSSTPEFRNSPDRTINTLNIDNDLICDACKFAETKDKIDWNVRENSLLELLDKHRSDNGQYDCIVPGSGGKDSSIAAHVLKYKYGMHPLTVTWPPTKYTEIGYKNFLNWIDIGGFDNVSFRPNGEVHRLLTKLAVKNLLHPFQPFVLGQKNLAPKIALQYKIPLVFYGENEAEYGNPIADNSQSLRDKSYFSTQNLSDIRLGGVTVTDLQEEHGLSLSDIQPYLPASPEALVESNIEVHYLGYYLKWTPQEAYYYAVENTGFEANPIRTEGTYSKYNSLDDKIDGLHYYTTYIKFGIGRATYDASQEIRNRHITREEAVALVQRFDGEFPERDLNELMQYLDMSINDFNSLCDKFRSPHLWEKLDNTWNLKHSVS